MNSKYVEVKTEKNLYLFGNLFSNNSDKCILYIPGISGNFYESKFARVIAEQVSKENIDFLFGHNQGSFQIMNFKYMREDGKIKDILKGAAYEDYDDSNYDIDAWIKFLKERNYKKIILIAHSLGCNKVIKYLNKYNYDGIDACILLSPQDIRNAKDLSIHKGMYDEALYNIKNNNPEKILSKKFLCFCNMCSKTFYDFIEKQKELNNIPYKDKNGDFSKIRSINIPIYSIIGTKDGGENSEEYMKNISENCKKGKFDIINGAKHNFDDYEEYLSEIILNYIKEIW